MIRTICAVPLLAVAMPAWAAETLKLANGNREEAAKLFKSVVAVRPDHAEGHVALANLRHWQDAPAADALKKERTKLLFSALSEIPDDLAEILVAFNRRLPALRSPESTAGTYAERARLDGANAFQRWWHVTVPLISPAILFNLILGIIGSFRVFSLAFVTTAGGPAYSTYFYALHLYALAVFLGGGHFDKGNATGRRYNGARPITLKTGSPNLRSEVWSLRHSVYFYKIASAERHMIQTLQLLGDPAALEQHSLTRHLRRMGGEYWHDRQTCECRKRLLAR